ncbi:MAG: DUF2993 domain-containing protein [Propionibacteriaceae bacterium]|nr:DUF2993 domain-containing protein [Propionibacteriaceae bacterium]
MRRVLGVLLALVLVAVAVVIGGAYLFDDRIRDEAQRQVAANLKAGVPFTVTPTVEIAGHPFAWHLLTQRYPSVRVTGAQAPVTVAEGTTLNLLNVDVTLTDVTTTPDAVRAASLAGTGRITWDEVSALAGVQIGDAGGGRLSATGSADVFGVAVTGSLTGVPHLDVGAQTLTIADPQLEVAGVRLPDVATRALVAELVQPFEVPLPYGLGLDAVEPRPNGLGLSVSGVDVEFPTA